MLESLAVLVCALLFGGMVLYSFGFAAFIFTSLPSELAGPTIRRAFPHFYLFVLVTSALGTVLVWPDSTTNAALLGFIALTTIPNRQLLMPAINRATDSGQKSRFKALHGLSVLLTLVHIGLAATVLVRLAS